jgi:hypothetical protein
MTDQARLEQLKQRSIIEKRSDVTRDTEGGEWNLMLVSRATKMSIHVPVFLYTKKNPDSSTDLLRIQTSGEPSPEKGADKPNILQPVRPQRPIPLRHHRRLRSQPLIFG